MTKCIICKVDFSTTPLTYISAKGEDIKVCSVPCREVARKVY